MAKIEKRGNKYRTRVSAIDSETGQRRQPTISGRSAMEVREKEAQFYRNGKQYSSAKSAKTLEQGALDFLAIMDGSYSPVTLSQDLSKVKTHLIGSPLGRKRMGKVEQIDVQKWVSDLGKKGLKGKTIKNCWSVVRRTLKFWGFPYQFDIKIKESEAYVAYMPTAEEVKAVLDRLYEKDRQLYIVALLNVLAPLRRSEVCALNREDILNGSVIVNKAMKLTPEKTWVIAANKTRRSVRTIHTIPDWVLDLLPKSGRITTYNPNQVTNYFNRIVSAMPDVHYFRYQDFRGFAASYMIQQGLGLVSTTKDSGWTSTRTADKHYFQSIRDIEDEQREKLIKSYDYFRPSK